jgi:hypothetical protein
VKSLHFSIFLLICLGILSGCINPQGPNPTISISTISPTNSPATPASEKITINLIINDGNSKVSKKIGATKGISPLEAFQEVAEIGYKKYPFGSYVYSVNCLKENTDNSGKYWQYYVNGKIVMVAVDNYKLDSDAEIEFRYEAQNPQIK